ncbi:MAG: hypothetical protein RBS53_11165 [Bacteroidales bacterium]|jgi:hypothetical protein|nr:hypothetical protein [Bacteroidales bacterium]
MIQKPALPLSYYTKIGLMAILLVVSLMRYKENIISWDTFGYYLYLPATFIHHDPGLKDPGFVEEALQTYKGSTTLYQASEGPEGGLIIKYSSGLSILFLPGFALAHGVALVSQYPADGFSLPYQHAVFITSLLFSFFGLFFIRKVLLKYFSDRLSAVLMVLLFLGTNLFYISVNHTLVHNFLFALYALLLWLVIRWHEQPCRRLSVWLGLTLGLIIIIRPTDIISLIIPLLWGVYDWKTLKEKFRLIREQFGNLLIMGGCMILPALPQLIYWKALTGSFFYYSYDNPGEGLDLLTPYTWDVLFSFRKGWLIYTPLMALAIYGFKNLYEKRRELFFPLVIFAALNLYLVSAWTTWWYAGSFGHRAMVQSYAMMAIPLGYFFIGLKDQKKFWRKVFYGLAAFFVVLNLFQTWQYFNKILKPDGMTRPYYMAALGRVTPPDEEMLGLLMVQRSLGGDDVMEKPENYYLYRTFEIEFEGDTWIPGSGLPGEEAREVTMLTPDNPFTKALEIPFNRLTMADHAFLKVRGEVFIAGDVAENPFSLIITFDHKGGNYKYRGKDYEHYPHEITSGQWNTLERLYLTPEPRNKADQVRIYFWLRGDKPLPVGRIDVEVWVPKRGW